MVKEIAFTASASDPQPEHCRYRGCPRAPVPAAPCHPLRRRQRRPRGELGGQTPPVLWTLCEPRQAPSPSP